MAIVAVTPGFVDTEMLREMLENEMVAEELKRVRKRAKEELGRWK